MKILLINPPRSSENSILKYASDKAKYYIHKKLIGPPLGLLTIAASVKDYDVTFLEMKGEYDLDPDAPDLDTMVLDYLKSVNPDIVGVTFIASEFYLGLDIFKAVKKYNPNILTVAGGLHATLCPNDFIDSSVDVVCPGQSANIFRKLVEAVENKTSLGSIKGIYLKKDGEIVFTGASTESWDPVGRDFIMPDRSLLKRWVQTYKVGNSPDPSTYLYTSLGCPYKCSFCSIWPQFDGKFHQREIESIINELKDASDYNVVRFADANTIVDVDFIDKLCDRILEEKFKKVFIMDIRFDTAVNNPGLIEKLAKCGLKVVICGFESFRESELKKYNKGSSASLIHDAVNIFQRNGIMLRGNYVIPSDYDEDDFKAIAEYASQHKVAYAGYTILTPMPGTVFYNEVKDQIVDFDLSKYNFFNCVFKTKLPLEKFYENVGNLWLIKRGQEVI